MQSKLDNGKSFHVSDGDFKNPVERDLNISIGDRIICLKNGLRIGVRNGTCGKVINIDDFGNNSSHCSASDLCAVIDEKASEISTAISNIKIESNTDSKPDDDLLDKVNDSIFVAFDKLKSHTTILVLGATFFISCCLAGFVWWFRDVPAQTQAVNNYVYPKVAQEKSSP